MTVIQAQADRLYGRARGHTLRARQVVLIERTLPRVRFDRTHAGTPLAGFAAGLSDLWLEVGFGGGEHALAQMRVAPDVAIIACEVFENGICSLLGRLVPEGGEVDAPVPGNLRVWDDDARTLIRALPEASLDRLFLLFPDPWPKARHAKRRFVHPSFLPEVARVMKPGAEWRIASDDPTYQAWVAGVLAGQEWFAGDVPARERPQGWPGTRYEAKALKAGRGPMYWTWRRTGVATGFADGGYLGSVDGGVTRAAG